MVKYGGDITHDWTDGANIEVPEVGIRINAEIVVSHITTAYDGSRVVSDKRLVVHSIVDSIQV